MTLCAMHLEHGANLYVPPSTHFLRLIAERPERIEISDTTVSREILLRQRLADVILAGLAELLLCYGFDPWTFSKSGISLQVAAQ